MHLSPFSCTNHPKHSHILPKLKLKKLRLTPYALVLKVLVLHLARNIPVDCQKDLRNKAVENCCYSNDLLIARERNFVQIYLNFFCLKLEMVQKCNFG